MTLECKVRTARDLWRKGISTVTMISCGMAPWCDQDYFARSCRADFDHIWGVPPHRHMQEWVGAPLDTRVHDVSSHKFWYKLCGLSYRGCASTQAHRHMQGWVAKQSYRMLQNICWKLFILTYLGCASDHSYHSCWIDEHGRSRLTPSAVFEP